ncbi:MAG: SMC-Scp complex subunit ScpB [Cyanobacteria bacterium NC_groundwater_1444_Ag_S-0.65um_54_12]|nr:SMC-Scp complex subunit ScpB [Cyanobacteria bacterium NC_groundwater_1444_Ag_S-0.65um_54_12]
MKKRLQPNLHQGESVYPLVEAALFATNRPLAIDEIATLLALPRKAVKLALEQLVADYANRENSALEIGLAEGYILQVKSLYQRVADRLLPTDLSAGILRTLGLIATRAPILQCEIIKLRGTGAYEHIRELVKRELIQKTASGNSFELKLGPKFTEYFEIDPKDLAAHFSVS